MCAGGCGKGRRLNDRVARCRDLVGSPEDAHTQAHALEVMHRVAPPLSARQKERQRGRRPGKDVDTATSDATWAASLDGDEQDEGAPFAVLEADGEGRGSRGLQALLRLLERKEPSFLLEEDGAASGGSGGASVGEAAGAGILDSELDSFLSMPAASDLSVVPSPPPPRPNL